jgi:hypothetical protein
MAVAVGTEVFVGLTVGTGEDVGWGVGATGGVAGAEAHDVNIQISSNKKILRIGSILFTPVSLLVNQTATISLRV